MSTIPRVAVTLATSVAVGVSADVADARLLAPAGSWPTAVAAPNPVAASPSMLNGAHASANASLRVWLPKANARLTVIRRRIGGRTVVRGRLQNRDTRRSISAATVQLVAQPAGPSSTGGWSLVDVARTTRKGTFRAVLPAGATRRVAVVYWPTAVSPTPVFSRRLLVRATARVYLKTSMLPGRRMIVRGRVSGAAIPAGGLLVAAQVRNGRRWATIRLVRSRQSGRFVARYRFKYRGRGYVVRALAPSQPAWPLYSGHSQSHRVRTR